MRLVDVAHCADCAPADQAALRPARTAGPARVGYARTLHSQHDLSEAVIALHALQVHSAHIYIDRGIRSPRRPQLGDALTAAGTGGTLAVASLARLARSHADLVNLTELLTGRGVALEVAGSRFDQIEPARLIRLTAQLEADLIAEAIANQKRYLARRRDLRGQPPALAPMQAMQLRELFDAGLPPADLCALFGISRATLYRYVRTDPKQ